MLWDVVRVSGLIAILLHRRAIGVLPQIGSIIYLRLGCCLRLSSSVPEMYYAHKVLME